MRFEGGPVDVTYLTRKLAMLSTGEDYPAQRVANRGFNSWGGPPIPQDKMACISSTIKERTRLLLTEVIGGGGTGTVFVAQHKSLPLHYAAKVIYYGERDDTSAFLRALHSSISSIAKVTHPAVIRVHDTGSTDEFTYVIMDLHNPDRNFRTIASLLTGRNRYREVLALLEQVIEGLAYCHSVLADVPIRGSRGVLVHGDIKAENVLLDFRNQPVLTDWLVPNLGRRRGPSLPYHDTRCYGTPMYMPPEQSSHGVVTPASDVWNLGVLVYEALTGFYPFERVGDIEQGKAMPIERFAPFAPLALNAVVFKCLRGDHRKRYGTACELLEAWREAVGSQAGSSQRHRAKATVKRVFLSSTFRDLAPERDAATCAINRLGGAVCIAMEHRGAAPVPPRDACLTEVTRSDILVLVIGYTYGSIDPPTSLSMTRMEFEHARRQGIPVLAYVKNRPTPDREFGLEPRVEPLIEPDVREFIEALDGVTFASFSDPADLALQIVCDIARLCNSSESDLP